MRGDAKPTDEVAAVGDHNLLRLAQGEAETAIGGSSAAIHGGMASAHMVNAVVLRATSSIHAYGGKDHLASVLFISIDRLTRRSRAFATPPYDECALFD